MNGWGEDGPIIGPIQLSFTYGTIRLHDAENDDDVAELKMNDERTLIKLGHTYYGDFETLDASEVDILMYMGGYELMDYSNFKALNDL